MTDARFPERWLTDRRLQRLSDSHFRSFMTSLTWSVANRTDGLIDPEDLPLIPNFSADAPSCFVASGLWRTRRVSGWVITDYEVTQTSREQLDAAYAAKVREREKKAKQRAAKAARERAVTESVPGDNPGDIPRDDPREIARLGQGQGQSRLGQENSLDAATDLKLCVDCNDRLAHGSGSDPTRCLTCTADRGAEVAEMWAAES